MDVGHLVANVRRLGRTFTLSFTRLNAPRHTLWSSLFFLGRVAMEVLSWVCIFAEIFIRFFLFILWVLFSETSTVCSICSRFVVQR